MDPKSLDPKLRETYERVMGTAVPPSGAPTTVQIPVTPAPPSDGLSSPVPNGVSANNFDMQAAAVAASQPLPSPASMIQQPSPTETSTVLRIAYIAGGIIFFMVYTVFWIKIFKLPFLF